MHKNEIFAVFFGIGFGIMVSIAAIFLINQGI